jgi:transposase
LLQGCRTGVTGIPVLFALYIKKRKEVYVRVPYRLQVGIDVSKSSLDFALLAPDGEPIEAHKSFANSLAGYEKAKQLLLEVMQEHEFEGVDIAAEATSYYWLPGFMQFATDEDLASYDPELYLLNARWVRWYKQSLSPDHKDDMTDPLYIADRIRTHKPASAWVYDPKWLKLRLLTRLHAHLSKSIAREKNLFQLYLFLTYTTYAHHHPFHHELSCTSQRLLQHPDLLEYLADLPIQELAEALYEISNHHLQTPLKNAVPLKRALRDSFPLPEELADTIQFILCQLMETIQHLEDDLAAVDKHVEEMLQQDDYGDVSLLRSIPGVGPVIAAGLAAEIAGLDRFTQVQKYDKKRKCYRPRHLHEIEDAIGKIAGLWWPKNASGRFAAEERPMSKEGNAYLRYYILQAAERMRQRIPSYAAYYKSEFDQALKHKHKRAMVLTGRKALALFVSLLYHKEVYRTKEALSA